MIISYEGIVSEGVEDRESDAARSLIGGRECYLLTSQGESTRLDISGDMDESMFDMMSQAWDKALEKIKMLSLT